VNGITLGPGDSCTFSATFTPASSSSGNRTGKVTASASPGGTVSTSLSGTALNAQLSISPSGYNFDSVAVNGGVSSPITFTVTNTGAAISGAITFTKSGGAAAADRL